MENTTVTNKATGHKYHYSCPPREAVVCAYEQYDRNFWNTWQYDYRKAALSPDGKEWSCGSFTAPAKADPPTQA
jgi:hypothetical protein